MPCGTDSGEIPAGTATSHRTTDEVEESVPLGDPCMVAVGKFLLGISIATDSDIVRDLYLRKSNALVDAFRDSMSFLWKNAINGGTQ